MVKFFFFIESKMHSSTIHGFCVWHSHDDHCLLCEVFLRNFFRILRIYPSSIEKTLKSFREVFLDSFWRLLSATKYLSFWLLKRFFRLGPQVRTFLLSYQNLADTIKTKCTEQSGTRTRVSTQTIDHLAPLILPASHRTNHS